ncbi:MAG: 2-oxoacid:ferredoxin oxidoreductase subunit beta, partial [Syntrophobacteria bacterium]
AINAIKKALQHKGFGMVEIVSQCPINFGRRALGTGDPLKNIQWIEERSVTVEKAGKLPEEELSRRFVLGNFIEKHKPVFKGSSVYEPEGG